MSNSLRAFWNLMAVVSCLIAFVYVLFGDASTAFSATLSGVAFFLMSHLGHEDLDL